MFSFTENKKSVDLHRYMRRLCDLTAPIGRVLEERREERYNRVLPTLFAPWIDERPIIDECTIGLTSDLSDNGVGVVLQEAIDAPDVLVCFWVPARDAMREPWFFVGRVRRNDPIGGGFSRLGVELLEHANDRYAGSLVAISELAQRLLSPTSTF